MSSYTNAEIDAGIIATADRGSCEHERKLRRGGIEIRCDRCDVIATLDAAGPAIAARALRDLADAMEAPDWNHKDDWGVPVVYPNALRTRADLIERSAP